MKEEKTYFQGCKLGTTLSVIFTLSHFPTLLLPLGPCRCIFNIAAKRKENLIFPKVKEEDRGLVEKPEQLMLLPEYMEAWQRALDRQKEREEAAVKEAEDDVEEEEVEEDVSSQDESKSKDEKMEVESDEEPKNGVESSNGHESNTAQGNIEIGHTDMFKCFAFCKGFTDEDCDVEEYFEENHENVEQVIFS